MPVGFLHRCWRVFCGDHDIFDKAGEDVEIAGGRRRFFDGFGLLGFRLRMSAIFRG